MNVSPQDKELLRRIDEVLHYMWDPIGIAGVPQARDEYESYVSQVFQLLKATVDGKDVAEYLHWLSTEHIGMAANPDQDSKAVGLLLGWRDHLSG
ncbi:hypothetical protein [Dyella koreensis]|uniref:Uncharacterized protein n=1 Tax=Dyella koreensis TaxID=311235 RepID=A0ABW8K122_9GAMM